MRRVVILLLCGTIAARADPFFPETVGTTWEYDHAGAEPNRLTVRIAGQDLAPGRDLLKLETLAEDRVLKTELLSAGEHGVILHERRIAESASVPFNPPRVLLPIPLQVGTTWELDDEVEGSPMHQSFKVVALEKITVPAGLFQAYHLHCEQPWPISVSVDRWFAPGVGFIKEITTIHGPGGRLLSRVVSALTKFTLAPPPPEPPPSAIISTAAPQPVAPPKITVQIAKERDGERTTSFRSDSPNIYVRWEGENLPINSVVRVVWIAEDVGEVAEPNFIVDQTETEITSSEFSARFTLSRPSDGWAEGKYRLEVYLDNVLAEKLEVTIKD